MVIKIILIMWTLAAFGVLEFNYCCGRRSD